MRISTAQIFNRSAENITSTSNSLYEIQQQMSTGKRVLTPSDDPLASAQIMKLTKEVDKTEQYQDNIDIARNRVSLEEITLDAINDSINKIKELTIQANSGVLSDTDRGMIANELQGIEKSLFAQMNTKDTQGEYLFSGHKGFDPAYRYDGASDSYVYGGDEGQRYVQIGPEHNVASTDSGFEIFEKVPGVLSIAASADPSFSDQLIVNYAEFQSFTDSRGPATVTFDPAGATYSVTDRNGDPVLSGNPASALTNVPYVQDDVIEFEGVRLTIDTPPTPVLPAVTVSTDIVAEEQRDNILNLTHKLVASLKSLSTEDGSDGGAQLEGLIARTLTSLEGVQNKNIEARGTIGGRINAMDQQEQVNEDYLLFTKSARSAFQDLDYNKAISDFTLQETALNAAYGSFSKISSLSLFNYLN